MPASGAGRGTKTHSPPPARTRPFTGSPCSPLQHRLLSPLPCPGAQWQRYLPFPEHAMSLSPHHLHTCVLPQPGSRSSFPNYLFPVCDQALLKGRLLLQPPLTTLSQATQFPHPLAPRLRCAAVMTSPRIIHSYPPPLPHSSLCHLHGSCHHDPGTHSEPDPVQGPFLHYSH